MSSAIRPKAGDGVAPASPSRRQRVVAFVVVVAVVVLLDQLSKQAVRVASPQLGWFGTLVPGLLDLVRVENSGAAFSVGEGAGPLFVVSALAVAVLALVLVVRETLPLPLVISIACVVGGGVGNLVDRVAQGSVTDFIATTFVSFPVFNVADVFVTCGVIASVVGWWLWEAGNASPDNGA